MFREITFKYNNVVLLFFSNVLVTNGSGRGRTVGWNIVVLVCMRAPGQEDWEWEEGRRQTMK